MTLGNLNCLSGNNRGGECKRTQDGLVLYVYHGVEDDANLARIGAMVGKFGALISVSPSNLSCN